MLKPKKLMKNDKVAIVSLSSGIAGDKKFNHKHVIGKKRLEEIFGVEVIVMPNSLSGSEILYNNPKLRAKDLMDAFQNKDIKAIFCNIGGDDTIRLLSYIDMDIIKNNPKIFMGYSDTTVNHFMLQKCGLVSYYGPSIMAEFAENVSMHDYTINAVENVLFNNTEDYTIASSANWTSESLSWEEKSNNKKKRCLKPEKNGIEILQSNGNITGELIGGCIDTFHMFIGSEIWPRDNWDKKILILETSEDIPSPDFIIQLFRNPLMTDALKKVKGIIFGKPYDEVYYQDYKDVIINFFSKEIKRKDIFIAYNYNFGHTAPMCVLPFGIKVEISSETGFMKFLESATEEN